VPKEYLSLSSLDFDKTTVMIGGGLYVGKHWRLDAVYGHTFTKASYVPAGTAQIERINPLRGNLSEDSKEPVNGGTYSASADLIGVGMRYAF
jgi:hypothetical protein